MNYERERREERGMIVLLTLWRLMIMISLDSRSLLIT